MKKYIAPSVEVLAYNTESMLALSITEGYGDGNQLSNNREIDADWDEE